MLAFLAVCYGVIVSHARLFAAKLQKKYKFFRQKFGRFKNLFYLCGVIEHYDTKTL